MKKDQDRVEREKLKWKLSSMEIKKALAELKILKERLEAIEKIVNN